MTLTLCSRQNQTTSNKRRCGNLLEHLVIFPQSATHFCIKVTVIIVEFPIGVLSITCHLNAYSLNVMSIHSFNYIRLQCRVMHYIQTQISMNISKTGLEIRTLSATNFFNWPKECRLCCSTSKINFISLAPRIWHDNRRIVNDFQLSTKPRIGEDMVMKEETIKH